MPLPDSLVELDRAAWQALLAPPAAVDAAPAPWVADREVTLDLSDGARRVRAVWRLEGPGVAAWSARLVGPGVHAREVRVDGAPAPLTWGPDGGWLHLPAGGAHTVTLDGWLDPAAPLSLLASARGALRVVGGDLVPTVQGQAAPQARGQWWTGAATVDLLAAQPRGGGGDLAVARADLGVTLGDTELTVRGRATWEVRRGSLSEVRLQLKHGGDDLVVTGPPGSRVERAGDRVTVVLAAPEHHQVSVSLRSSVRLPADAEAQVALPELIVLDAARSDRSLVLARDSDLELLPDLRGGTATLTASARARDLIAGAPIAARTGDVSGALTARQFVPAERPAILVDVADATVTFTPEGRSLAQLTWTLRNETAAALLIRLPPGHRALAVRVDGEPVPVAVEGDTLRVPLPRSPETVQGPLAFPVELAVLGDGLPAWTARGEVTLPLPTVDAPVAVRRVTVNLPDGWALRDAAGAVEAFSEGQGLAYGFGATAAAAQQEAAYRGAVQAWMENDFEGAQAALDQVRSLGDDNENVRRLQSNIDYVSGDSTVDTAEARRVRDLAATRGQADKDRQEDLLYKAKEAEASGDAEAAEAAWSEVIELSGKLEQLEQKEDQRQELVVQEARKKLEVARQPVRAPASAKPAKSADADDDGDRYDQTTGYDAPVGYDAPGDRGDIVVGDLVDGELVAPTSPSVEEPAPDEPQHLLDGAQFTDPVTGTFSSNFNYDAVTRIPRPSRREAPLAGLSEPVQNTGTTSGPAASGAAAPEPSTSTVTITRNELARIPSGLSFAGEAPIRPPPPPPPPRATVTAVSASLIIPVPGEVARLQHLLVPALDAAPLTLTLRPLRRSPR
jgi:hypothetical protein